MTYSEPRTYANTETARRALRTVWLSTSLGLPKSIGRTEDNHLPVPQNHWYTIGTPRIRGSRLCITSLAAVRFRRAAPHMLVHAMSRPEPQRIRTKHPVSFAEMTFYESLSQVGMLVT